MLGAGALFSVIGMAALSVELAQGYQTRIAYQGAADVAALAAANAYSSSQTDAVLTATANDIARANGISTSSVSVTHVSNYSSSVSDAVKVVITRQVPLYFARVLHSSASYTVSVQAIASLATSSTPPCIIALSSSGSGITMSGGTAMTAPKCGVFSNTSTSLSGGTSLSALGVNSSTTIALTGGSSLSATNIIYGTSLSATTGTSVSGTQTKKSNSITDPESTNTTLTSAFGNLGTYTTPQVPSVPTGTDLTLAWYPTTMTFQNHTGTLSNGVWTFPAGTYNIANLNTGSTKLVIQGSSTVTVSGTVTVGGGGGLTIGDGPVAMVKSVSLSGGTAMSLGAGRHYLGPITVSGGSTVSIGAGDLDVNGAFSVSGGGSTVTLGAGNYAIGNDGSGNSITLSGGSTMTMGAGTFSANGAITTAGGSSITFGATANHLVNGALNLNGTATFGAGTYLVNGAFTNNTGGTMTGSGVSFILAGSLNAAGGTSINLSAPTSSSTTGITDILFATKSTTATKLGGGTQDIFSGIIYVPNSDLTMSGGATASGTCFSIIAKSITLSGGTTAATYCPSLASSGSSSSSVTLVQ